MCGSCFRSLLTSQNVLRSSASLLWYLRENIRYWGSACFMQYIEGTNCPAWKKELIRLRSSSEYTEFMDANRGFLDEVCRNAGYSVEECTLANSILTADNIEMDVSCAVNPSNMLQMLALTRSLNQSYNFSGCVQLCFAKLGYRPSENEVNEH